MDTVVDFFKEDDKVLSALTFKTTGACKLMI